jgi:hypothetical protein
MLSVDDLAGMVDTLTESLPDTCTLLHDTTTSNGAGGQRVTGVTSTSVACRVSPLRLTRSSKEAEVIEVGRVAEESLWTATFPDGTVLDPTYRIGHEGREFEVVEVLAPRSWGLDVRCTAKLVNSGAG